MDCWWKCIAESQGIMRSCTIKNFKAQQWSSESHTSTEDRGVTSWCHQEGCEGPCPCQLFCVGHEVWLLWWGGWGCSEVMEHLFWNFTVGSLRCQFQILICITSKVLWEFCRTSFYLCWHCFHNINWDSFGSFRQYGRRSEKIVQDVLFNFSTHIVCQSCLCMWLAQQ